MTTAFWWRVRPNFGDALTPLLLARFSDLEVTWAPVAEAELLVVGSIIDMLPDNGTYKGAIVGAGVLRGGTDVRNRLRNANIYALRGPLTAAGIKGSFALGDGGLLANELVSVDKEYNLGILAHWTDHELQHRFSQWEPRIIHPNADPLIVIREIGKCRKLVTSSLHGVIVADAFGIPRRIEYSKTLDREGGDFKFRDYHAALSMPLELGKTARPSQRRIEDMQSELFDAFEALGDDIRKGAA
jgi:hypothetical protein